METVTLIPLGKPGCSLDGHIVTRSLWPGSMRFSKNRKQRMGQPGPRRHASGLKRCREGHQMLDHSQGKSYGWVNQTTAFHFTCLVSQLFTGFPPGFHGSHSISLWKVVLHRAPGCQPSHAPCWMDRQFLNLSVHWLLHLYNGERVCLPPGCSRVGTRVLHQYNMHLKGLGQSPVYSEVWVPPIIT